MAAQDVILAIVGDIYVQREDPSSIFRHVGHILRKADIALGNQEVSLSTKRTSWIPGRRILRSESEMVQALTSAGFDVVGLANNHSMDCGIEGIMETLEVLDQAKIAHCGAGANIEEAHKPAIIERNGTRVAFLSYASVFPDVFPAEKDRPGIAVVQLYSAYQPHFRVLDQPATPPTVITTPEQADLRLLQQDIANARAKADLVVVSWHWGVSQGGDGKVVDYQREMGKFALDAGADLIFGHHPHVLQGIEVYKGKAIFYSLGNFTFARELPPEYGRETIIVHCQIRDKKIRGISFLPIFPNEQLEPEVVVGEKGRAIFQLMQQLSAPFGTTMESSNGEIVITGISL